MRVTNKGLGLRKRPVGCKFLQNHCQLGKINSRKPECDTPHSSKTTNKEAAPFEKARL